MEKIAVFVNDAAHARHILQPLLESAEAAHWVLVACPPVFSRHIGRFASKAARVQWRERWAQAAFADLEPLLKTGGGLVETLVARRPLVEVSARLVARLGSLRLLDARRPHLGKTDEPLTAGQPAGASPAWAVPVVITGLSAVLALAD
ncbi:hypothetical protein [Piscinibacter terrae]|uniref:Uncharacterized protein n=1 Tax=Piscinibacter terrae TaxID=2496871 RepID=A0A3N7HQH4_9BURK|nr:hypothetical protein [Albitalea terrae]RQP24488.1 hypothetical protein DZC73_14480 [Albitalea terrae]